MWTAADTKLGLWSSMRQSRGAMSHLTREVVELIEQILQDEEDRKVGLPSYSLSKAPCYPHHMSTADLEIDFHEVRPSLHTRFGPGVMILRIICGRLENPIIS